MKTGADELIKKQKKHVKPKPQNQDLKWSRGGL